MSSDELLVTRGGDGISVVTLNRPASLNAITMSLQERLDDVISTVENDGYTRCLVVKGAGGRAFSSGYDLHEMAAWSADDLLLRLLERERWVWHFATASVPIVVALGGVAYGAGAILASAADIRVGSTETRIKFTAAAYGGANATWTLPALVGRGAAAELLLTARTVHAEEAEAMGLLNRVVDPDTLDDASTELAEQIAANPAAGTRAIKRLLREHSGRSVEDCFVTENLLMRTDLRPEPIVETYVGGNGSFRPSASL
ncbi:MAG: crt 17 [Solirubrobacterales bacterium]|nr:crt 17 [Solirubrobacterales bacterium]